MCGSFAISHALLCRMTGLQYGKVFKALWQGTEVAVKTIILPANMWVVAPVCKHAPFTLPP
jgi:hypothetical protein